jgi:putative ABC transport system ATP-binding protein
MSNGAIIETRDLRKVYRVGQVDVAALRGVDLDVQPGEFLSVVGPSGSGKSTLFHIIGGLTPPTAGEVKVGGQNLAALSDAGRTKMRRRTVGFVFQKFNLLPNLTARDNIAVSRYIAGLGTHPDAQFEEVLRLLGIAGRLDHKPNALSGGEQQRVAIARAIAKRPEVLLCDEPTGALDVKTGIVVLEAIQRANRELGTLTVLITHNATMADMADRVIHLSDGHVQRLRVNEHRVPASSLNW